jgi:PleD family two-component response regulator
LPNSKPIEIVIWTVSGIGASIDVVIQRADQALSAAKQAGRNRVISFPAAK